MNQFGVWDIEGECWIARTTDDGGHGVVADTKVRCERLAAALNGRRTKLEYEVRPMPGLDRRTVDVGHGLA